MGGGRWGAQAAGRGLSRPPRGVGAGAGWRRCGWCLLGPFRTLVASPGSDVRKADHEGGNVRTESAAVVGATGREEQPHLQVGAAREDVGGRSGRARPGAAHGGPAQAAGGRGTRPEARSGDSGRAPRGRVGAAGGGPGRRKGVVARRPWTRGGRPPRSALGARGAREDPRRFPEPGGWTRRTDRQRAGQTAGSRWAVCALRPPPLC